ncbi:AAA family ATPase [Gimesia chilikensis]|uniref:ATPase family associated with various cellular activities (AAA) n=1 Tax=Gimesia chilikensis TaxID=2605989 RepID=A0A517PPZ0_9PLAN|nr:MoxR family ATPase [Gimesia chilikensis]QDT21437.1 ATPase family associated with various cellular activities (AAA) [Gimesia chilikensis]
MASLLEKNIRMDLQQEYSRVDQLRDKLNQVLKGKADVIDNVIICLLSRGHLLLEDHPGLGKTMLAKALATLIGGRFARVQCTPDLLPSDITGFNIFNQKTHEFEFRQGPVFSDIMLADEINRATPRTQSALLEAMAERQVTVDAVRYQLSQDYFVIATQNPIDQHGTYPLPEAQLDRFAMKLTIGYPEENDEIRMLAAAIDQNADVVAELEPVFGEQELLEMQRKLVAIPVAESVQRYLVQIGNVTRKHAQVSLGLSPRGLLTWQRVAQAHAFLQQRNYVIPDDLLETALPVLSVRLGVNQSENRALIEEILKSVKLPEYTLPSVN